MQRREFIKGLVQLQILNASSEHDFDGIFRKLAELRTGALMIGGDALFTSHSEQLAEVAVRHSVRHSTRDANSLRRAV